MARVSVIVPSYNHAPFLRECIDSMLDQQGVGFELIVVDDGSTDGSLEILRGYGEQLLLLQQQGGRQARARNLALTVARGEFIAFLDSDDRYLPGRLASAVAAFDADPSVDVVWADYRTIDGAGQALSEWHWSPAGGDFRRELIAGNPICNATVTVRRRVLHEIGGFDERVPRVCDGAAWCQIAARGYRFLHLDRLVLDYRQHGANDSARFAAMTRDRDTMLCAAAEAYVRFGVITTPADLAWLGRAFKRQFAFRAAAWVQRERSRGAWSEMRAAFCEALGSDLALAGWARLQQLKHALSGRGRA